MSRQTQEVKRKLSRLNSKLLDEMENYGTEEPYPYDRVRLTAMQGQVQSDIETLEACVAQSKADKSDPLATFMTKILDSYGDLMSIPADAPNEAEATMVQAGKIDARFHTSRIANIASQR